MPSKTVLKRKEYDRKRYLTHIREYRLYMSNTPCTDCTETFPYYVMEWDHIPERGQKRFNISKVAGHGMNTARAQAEIAKCDLVCRNCHGLRTHIRMCMDSSCGCKA